ncbi:MAG TPA: hypothetical protein VJ020_13855 [Anaerolineales bacterium]|nr:hypothetical protein [Anaerolineales bacterium]
MKAKVSFPPQVTPGEAYEQLVEALQQVGLDISQLNHDQCFTRTQIVVETITLALEFGKPINLSNPASQALLSFAQEIESGALVEKVKQTAGVERFGTGLQMLDAVVAHLRQTYSNKKNEMAHTLTAFANTLQDIASIDEQDRLVAGSHLASRGNATGTPLQPFYQALTTHARIAALALALQ